MTEQTSTDLGVQGVPQDAMRRLAELQPGRPGAIFTSDLSVNEFLLVREAGFRPGAGAGTRSSTCCPRPCTTPASWP